MKKLTVGITSISVGVVFLE
ncbi:hypothetical protein DKB98_06095 [Enterococcus faecalis]|nr:hypothetical protein DKC02_03590 [Enterococcus faecalis]PWI85227.1 hypothetical protein DKC03_12680 [Enterococcus faecalis]PWI89425.1 hypothetical protein DKB98_06095 [Enterococcus faecalis]